MAEVNPNGSLSGQVAVVTGASSRIDEAITKRLAIERAKVVVSARTVEASDHFLPGTIRQRVAQIDATGSQAAALRCNFADPQHRIDLIKETEAVSRRNFLKGLAGAGVVAYTSLGYAPLAFAQDKRISDEARNRIWANYPEMQGAIDLINRGAFEGLIDYANVPRSRIL